MSIVLQRQIMAVEQISMVGQRSGQKKKIANFDTFFSYDLSCENVKLVLIAIHHS